MRSEHEGVTRRDLNRVALIIAVLFAAMTSLLFMRLVPAMHSTGSSWWMTFILVAVFIMAALVCNRRCRRQIVWHNRVMAVWLVVAGACFSICAGATVSTLLESGNPATVAVFCSSGIVVADMALMSVCVREPMVRGVVSAVSFVALPLALASAATVLFDLSVQLLAGMVVAASVCGIQMMPNIVVHVPDRYLVEWRTYMTRRWTLRGNIPEEARVLTRKDVRRDMDSFLAQYSTGFTLCVVLSVLGYAALTQWTDYHSLYDPYRLSGAERAVDVVLRTETASIWTAIRTICDACGRYCNPPALGWACHSVNSRRRSDASLDVHDYVCRAGTGAGFQHDCAAQWFPFFGVIPNRRRAVLHLHDADTGSFVSCRWRT